MKRIARNSVDTLAKYVESLFKSLEEEGTLVGFNFLHAQLKLKHLLEGNLSWLDNQMIGHEQRIKACVQTQKQAYEEVKGHALGGGIGGGIAGFLLGGPVGATIGWILGGITSACSVSGDEAGLSIQTVGENYFSILEHLQLTLDENLKLSYNFVKGCIEESRIANSQSESLLLT